MNRRRVMRMASLGAGASALGALAFRSNLVFAEDEHENAHWTYEGEEGPEFWGGLDDDYATCSGGTQQSPIDVTGEAEADLPNIEFSYVELMNPEIWNNGHTVQVAAATGGKIVVDDIEYFLDQFHFHTPSEHTVDGQAAAMEMHLVHLTPKVNETDPRGAAVVGVLLNEGAENEALRSVFEAVPPAEGTAIVTGNVDPNMLLPETRTTYRYTGSLTTPPCTEGVNWLLMTNVVEVSAEQIEVFRSIFENDARPVQPLNDRTIQEDTTP